MTIHLRFEVGDIREATNKAWGLGNDWFKVKIEQSINRQIQAKPRGGDRKSEIFKIKGNINRVWPIDLNCRNVYVE